MIQTSILKIRGYGPWTLTLGSDREHRLQALQARLYAGLHDAFSERGAIIFPGRHDEFFGITNGMDAASHAEALAALPKEVDVDASIGAGATPAGAVGAAHAARLENTGQVRGEAGAGDHAMIMHMDVDGLSSRGKSHDPYRTARDMFGLYHDMMEFFAARGSMAFFMGGDNFMVVSSDEARRDAQGFLDVAAERHGMRLNCGVGSAGTGREAARRATESLDMIRKMRASGEHPGIYEI